MPIQAVTFAIRDLLENALNDTAVPAASKLTVYVGPPDVDKPEEDLILFLMRVTPSADMRNAERIRPFPEPTGAPRKVEPAVPLDLHYLVTAGSPANDTADEALRRLGHAIQAIEAASPISVPSLCQFAVWLSLEPLSTEELSRIWGLFPNFNCRTSFVFRAAPVWIDPRHAASPAHPVISDEARSMPARAA